VTAPAGRAVLADAITDQTTLDLLLQTGTVLAVNVDGTLSVDLAGATLTLPKLNSYNAVVGDAVTVANAAGKRLALGRSGVYVGGGGAQGPAGPAGPQGATGPAGPTGPSWTPEFARYVKATAQTGLVPGAATGVGFDTAVTSSPLVTPNAGGTQFTLGAAGLWHVDVSVRVTGANMAATLWEGVAFLCPTGGATTTRYAGTNTVVNAVSGTAALILSTTRRFALNDTIAVNAIANNSSGTTGNWQLSANSEQVSFALTYLGP
jgi:hypothetical protein